MDVRQCLGMSMRVDVSRRKEGVFSCRLSLFNRAACYCLLLQGGATGPGARRTSLAARAFLASLESSAGRPSVATALRRSRATSCRLASPQSEERSHESVCSMPVIWYICSVQAVSVTLKNFGFFPRLHPDPHPIPH